jgi:hypothetical protein
MSSVYIRENYSRSELEMLRKELNLKVRELGELYDNTANYENLTPYQESALEWNRAGYDIGEQIHDTYAEIGAILEAEEALEA